MDSCDLRRSTCTPQTSDLNLIKAIWPSVQLDTILQCKNKYSTCAANHLAPSSVPCAPHTPCFSLNPQVVILSKKNCLLETSYTNHRKKTVSGSQILSAHRLNSVFETVESYELKELVAPRLQLILGCCMTLSAPLAHHCSRNAFFPRLTVIEESES